MGLALCGGFASGQDIVTTDPTPLQEDAENVVIYYHADLGNKKLMNVPTDEPIYAHTGVNVSDASGKVTEWQYAPTWGENEEKYALSYVGDYTWKLEIGNMREYYGVDPEETIHKLCFVFRNADNSKEGKTEDGGDIFVDVLDTGFQLAFAKSILYSIVTDPEKNINFTATTTAEANIQIDVNGTVIGEATGVTTLKCGTTFPNPGDYVVTATATDPTTGITLKQSFDMCYPEPPVELTLDKVPALGLTRNADGTSTFCFAAPEKEYGLLVGSWNDYKMTNTQKLDYVDVMIEGAPFRHFIITLPNEVVGDEFSYYYCIDGNKFVGDPYALLVLDPSNDKYISPEVYPDLPAYPSDKVSGNVPLAYFAEGMLDYDWNVTNFKGASKDNLIIYELLFRDFTGTEGLAKGNGTVRAAIEKIPYLKQLGINAVELLPINEFNGNNSWGYNPNFYFAIDKAYGTPQDYKEFIDKCHAEGIAVILDVVFNQADWLHPWYALYSKSANPFFNATAPHAYSVLNDWNQGYPLVEQQWKDMLKFWLSEYNVDGFRFDLVKGLGDNDSYPNAGDSGTNAFNQSRVDRMKRLHDAMREVNPDAYFINENLAGAKEENEMAEDGELNWLNMNDPGCQFAMGYSSNSSLLAMWAPKASRTAGSTVSYLESHDEQRLAYKQDMWGVAGVKGDDAISCRRLAGAAAQMILVPGSHMIWMFSEMGNAQNTKDNSGGNNTSPKIVNWDLLENPANYDLMYIYSRLISTRLNNLDLFDTEAEGNSYTNTTSGWKAGRTIFATTPEKELYCVINPNVTGNIEVTVPFRSDNNADYTVAIACGGSEPRFDAEAKTVTIQPNCMAVFTNLKVDAVNEVADAEAARAYGVTGAVRVTGADAPVAVYTLDGACVATAPAASDITIPLPAGLYIVKAGKLAAKVIVK